MLRTSSQESSYYGRSIFFEGLMFACGVRKRLSIVDCRWDLGLLRARSCILLRTYRVMWTAGYIPGGRSKVYCLDLYYVPFR